MAIAEGFQEVHRETFEDYGEEHTMNQMIWFVRGGMILQIESYNTTSLNTAKVIFDVRAFKSEFLGGCSGGFNQGFDKDDPSTWTLHLDRDVREGFRLFLRELQQYGEVLPIIGQDWGWWPLNYREVHDIHERLGNAAHGPNGFSAAIIEKTSKMPGAIRSIIRIREVK
jgi:hypothetical protein